MVTGVGFSAIVADMKTTFPTLRLILIGGLFLIPLTGFIVSSSLFFPYIVGKAFFFRTIVLLLFGGWLVSATLSAEFRPRRSALLWTLGALLGILIAATALGYDPARSFWSNYERSEGLITYLHLGAYFLVLISVLRTEVEWRRYLSVMLGAIGVLALYGVGQRLGFFALRDAHRLDATLGNPAYLAVTLLFGIFLTLWFSIRSERRWLSYGIVALEAIVLYYTATRGSLLGLLGGAFLGALWYAFRGDGRARRRAGFGALAVVVLVVGFFALRHTSFVTESPVLARFANISTSETTTQSRFIIWGMSIEALRERPLLGWGPENFSAVFNKYYDPRLWRQEVWFDRSHNVFLDWLMAAGVLGLAAYVAVYAVALVFVLRRRPDSRAFSPGEQSLLLGLLAAYFIHNFFVFDHLVSYILFLTLLGYLHYRTRPQLPVPPPARPNSALVAGASIVAIIVIGVGFTSAVWRPLRANAALLQALAASTPDQQLTAFRRALKPRTYGEGEIAEQLAAFAGSLAARSEVPAAMRAEALRLATSTFEDVLARGGKNDARKELLYGSFLVNINELESGIAHLERSRTLSPQKQIIMIELGRADIRVGHIPLGLQLMADAVALDPTNVDARKAYGLMLLKLGQTALATSVLAPVPAAQIDLDPNFVNYYVSIKQFAKALPYFKAQAEAAPGDFQRQLTLAALYYEIGRRPEAIAVMEAAISVNPGYRADGEQIIADIRAGRRLY